MEKIDFAAISEDVARHLLGEPNRRLSGRHELRFGSKGAIALNTRAGQFFDHEAQEGGGVLHLIRHVEGGDPWQWLADRGFVEDRSGRDYTAPDLIEMQRRAAERDAERRKRDAQTEAEEKRKRELAARIWREARPIEGTPAETYLRGRAITSWPEDCARWHPAAPSYPGDPDPRAAIVFPFTDALGDVVAVMAVRLTPEGKKISDEIAKKTLGPMRKGMCILPGNGPLHLAEGPETALSVWLATGAPVMICGTAISARHVEQAPAGPLVLCSDAAPDGAAVAMALAGATGAAVARGLPCAVAVPNGPDKTDWNDLLQAQGAKAVREEIKAAIWIGHDRPATCLAPKGTVEEARRVVADAFERWRDQVLDPTPPGGWSEDVELWQALGCVALTPVQVLRVTTGVGKSYAARQHAIELAKEMRDRGDMRTVVIAVPRHNLGDEYLAEMADSGLQVAVYRGETATDPEALGWTMCRRPEDVQELRAAGGKRDELCSKNGVRCPSFDVCGVQRQKQTRADIWIVPHNLLWRNPPAALGEIAALVVDEDPTGTGLGGFDGVPYRLTVEDMRAGLRCHRDDDSADLMALAGTLGDALAAMESGPLRADLGLSAGELGDLRSLAFKAVLKPEISPTMQPGEIAARCAAVADQNRRAMRLARLASLIADARGEIVPGVEIEAAKAEDGATFKTVRMRWRETLHDRWNVPTVIASATAQRETLAAFWPDAGDVIEAGAAMPHATVRQITDVAFGLGTLAPKIDTSFAQGQRAQVARYIETRAAQCAPGLYLVVAQKRAIEALGAMPHNVETVHFNALTGLDRWGDVRGGIVIGRTLPGPRDAETRAEVLAGEPIERIEGWYPSEPAALDWKGKGQGPEIVRRAPKGQTGTPGSEKHPDPMAEAVRWSICEGELIQAIGRARGVNRTADNPVQIDILAAYPLPVAVDEAGPWKSFAPHPLDVMAARGIVVDDTSRKGAWHVVAAILPDMYGTPAAAKDAFARLTSAEPYKIPIRICASETTARLKLPGARYAVPVTLAAETETEARDLVARLCPGAVLIDLETPRPARRLVIVPEAEQIDSPIVADHIARRGVKRKVEPGVPLVPDLPCPPRSWWRVLADYPFLLWRARDTMPARELVPI